ncbi:MAG: hypothetical protein DIU69_08065 [Bacillota bacterium]|nr:MAG: hypothetical protein DIU69_08065 [Bacillota bacterium]
MIRARTESGTVYEFLGPDQYRRNGYEHRCIVWGAVAPAKPKGSLLFMVPLAKAPGAVHFAPVRILPGKVAVGLPVAFLLPDGDELRAIVSTPVVEVGDENGVDKGAEVGIEGEVKPLPEELLKKLMD